MPTAAENRNPPATAANEIGAGQPAIIEITPEKTTPTMIPAIPPVTLKITDLPSLIGKADAAGVYKNRANDLNFDSS